MECESKIFDSEYLKELLEFIFAYQNNYNKFLLNDKNDFKYNYFYVNTKNYHLLKWYLLKKFNLNDNTLLNNISERDIDLLKKNDKISNNISLKIFSNVFNYFASLGYKKEEIYKIFFDAGYCSFKHYLKYNLKFLILLNKSGIEEIVDSLEFINYKYNNTKFFSHNKEKIKENHYKISLFVTPVFGILNTREIVEWNCGIYKAFLEFSKDKIINQGYKINLDGSWVYFVEYISNDKKKSNIFFNKKIKNISNREYFKLKERQNLILISSRLKLKNLFFVQELIDNNHIPSGDHNNDVTFVALKFGKDLGLSFNELELLAKMSYLHDLGKACIPHEIISKPRNFDSIEQEVMKSHSVIGFSLALSLGFSLKESIGTLEHHFRADGSGYDKINWKKTSKYGLILQIVDVYCALIVKRSYKKGINDESGEWNMEKIKLELKKQIEKKKFYKDYGEFFLNQTLNSLEKILNDSKKTVKSKLIGYFKGFDDSYSVNKFDGVHPDSEIFIKNRYDALLYILKYFLKLSKKLKNTKYSYFPHLRNKFILENRKIKVIMNNNNLNREDLFEKLNNDLSNIFPLEISNEKFINSFKEYIDYLKNDVL
jgi:HD-GYP domain-containing protein (c-di-GMP phosphodiesterase class II)